MKLLNIKNFTKAVMDIESDNFTIKYCTERDDKYVIGIDAVHHSTKRFEPNRHYKLAIHKEEEGGISYQIWLWDMNKNLSYPLSIYKKDLKSTSTFTEFLSHILGLANEGVFDGVPGNRITLK